MLHKGRCHNLSVRKLVQVCGMFHCFTCLLLVLLSLLSFSMSTLLYLWKFQLVPKSQSRFGQFSCLPFLWPRPLAQSLPAHLVLLEVSWLWAHTAPALKNSPKAGGQIKFLRWDTGSQSAASMSGAKSSLLSHLTPSLALPLWMVLRYTPLRGSYLSRWTAQLRANTAGGVM